MKKTVLAVALMGLYLTAAPQAWARDVFSDTWTATDGLLRTVPPGNRVGPPKPDRTAGMFYWTWHYANGGGTFEPRNVQKILDEHPDAIHDAGYSAWGPDGSPHWWNEPLFGFYDDRDPWVLRKHAELLADAGVDVILFDITNGEETWQEAYEALFDVFDEARKDGVKTPQVVFLCAFGPANNIVNKIYEAVYAQEKHKDLWFYWEGKPLIMGYPENVPEPARSFFTFRPGQPLYDQGPRRPDHWGWLEIYPQHGFGPEKDGRFEQATVGVAQNYSYQRNYGDTAQFTWPGSFGRSYHGGNQDASLDAVFYGLNYQEQWRRGLELDPRFLFITGWNEWIAGKYPKNMEYWGGMPVNFVDEFCDEKSRDVEPSKGKLKDHYYYQTVANLRRYKGARAVPGAAPPAGVKIDGNFDDWAKAGPEFRDHRGGMKTRDFKGFGTTHYTDTSARNDIVLAKVDRDETFVYFYAETAQPLTPSDGKNWMWLLLHTGGSKITGWEDYDFIVNRVPPVGDKAVLEQNADNFWNWRKIGDVPMAVSGNQLELAIPREALGFAKDAKLDFEFKWADHLQAPGDIMDFYSSGDVAPNGRFRYHYTEHHPYADAGKDLALTLPKGVQEISAPLDGFVNVKDGFAARWHCGDTSVEIRGEAGDGRKAIAVFHAPGRYELAFEAQFGGNVFPDTLGVTVQAAE